MDALLPHKVQSNLPAEGRGGSSGGSWSGHTCCTQLANTRARLSIGTFRDSAAYWHHTGLNLTAASHVIHFDRWWNPAVENQATDRAFRIGQRKNVLVHKFVCRGTVEERIDDLIASKQQLSDEILSGGAESILTEMSNEQLISMVALDMRSAVDA